MPKYVFTVLQSFDLATHEVSFTNKTIVVKVSSSGQTVYNKDFSSGIGFRCDSNNFQIGTLNAETYLKKSINADISTADLWLVEKSNANQFIGSNDPSDESIYHIFNINQCPVQLSRDGNKVVMKCPCGGTSPCTNTCYKYGN